MRKGAKGEVGKRREAQEKRGGENNEDKVSAKVNIGLCNTSLALQWGPLQRGKAVMWVMYMHLVWYLLFKNLAL
jgi:hypothetical protein